jgi:hypothetical protein
MATPVSLVISRIGALHRARDLVHPGLRGGDRHPGQQTAEDQTPEIAAHLLFRRRPQQRQEQLRAHQRDFEPARHHADHGHGGAVDDDLAADDRRVASEARDPEIVSEQGDASPGVDVGRRERSPELRLDAEHVEDIGREADTGDMFGRGADGEVEIDIPELLHGAERRKDAALAAPVAEVARRGDEA